MMKPYLNFVSAVWSRTRWPLQTHMLSAQLIEKWKKKGLQSVSAHSFCVFLLCTPLAKKNFTTFESNMVTYLDRDVRLSSIMVQSFVYEG